MRKITKLYLILIATFCIAINVYALTPGGEERILTFDSNIKITQIANVNFHETITVNAQNLNIKRGIFRTINTRYRDAYGNKVTIDIDVTQVKRNGKLEAFHVVRTSEAVKIYIGSQHQFVPKGKHTYEIIYTVKNGLQYFKDFDEFYWNITGNNWMFYIDEVSATITLPADIPITKFAGYTGPYGAKGGNYSHTIDGNKVSINTTQSLKPYEGLTVAFAWPKGYVYEPSTADKASMLFKNNPTVLWSLICLLIMSVYYLVAWALVGKNPTKGTIIPLFKPPQELSPGMIHYIYNLGFKHGHKAYVAAITNLAIKGYVTISKRTKKYEVCKEKEVSKDAKDIGTGEIAIFDTLFNPIKHFTLQPSTQDSTTPKETKTKPPSNLDKIQIAILDKFYGKDYKEKKFKPVAKVKFEQKNRIVIQKSVEAFRKAIKKELAARYFVTNRLCFGIGIVLTVIYLLGLLHLTTNPEKFAILVSGGIFGTFISVFVIRTILLWRDVVNNIEGSLISAIFLTFIICIFLSSGFGFIIPTLFQKSPINLTVILIIFSLNAVFYFLLKRPTIYGRQIMDEIEGFKLFLTISERDELKNMAPDITTEMYEMYLPYAIALDIENAWSKAFEAQIPKLQGKNGSYSPSWYSSTTGFSKSGISGLMSGISSGIASATTSSSGSSFGGGSGSGGGGFSGGGGGGGGGGGW